MRAISQNLKTHLTNEATNLVKCLLINLSNQTKIGFTENDGEIIFEQVTYKPFSGFNLEKLNSQINYSQNAQIYAAFDDLEISENDIKSGKYLDADVKIFAINPENLSYGKLILQTGYVSEITYDKNKYYFQIESYSAKFKKIITQNYSKQCRAKFGDAKCGKNLDSYKFTGSVTSIINNYSFTDSTRTEENYYFNYGVIEFLSGANSGLKYDVKNFQNKIIELLLPPKFQLALNDQYEIIAGCDKEFSTCISKFNNAINFRGEPHIIGNEKLLKGA